MKKYISVLLAATLSAALLAGCGNSKSIDKQPAPKANEQTAQAEQTAAEPAESTKSVADAAVQTALAQTDAAQAVAGQETDADAQAGVYLIYVKDAETKAPIAGARVQFCSDVQCMMGKTDETGLAAFHSDSGKYTAHLLKAPEGYVTSTEEFELTEDSRTATYYLVKEGAEPAADQNSDVPKLQAEWDLPTTGLTITVPERFKEAAGQLWAVDRGEVDFGSGEVEAFILYQGRTDAEREEFNKASTENDDKELTDEQKEYIDSYYDSVPSVSVFHVIGLAGDKGADYIKDSYYGDIPIAVCDEIGKAGEYTYFYVVPDYTQYWDMIAESYSGDMLAELQSFIDEAVNTDTFKNIITLKEPVRPYMPAEIGSIVSFKTLDLEGNTVTSEELFTGHKITMVNFWGTWCNPCKNELEELEELSKKWAEQDCQIIGICTDALDDDMAAKAAKILEEHGVTYRNVRLNDEIMSQLLFVYQPTSYFVDSDGVVLDYPVAGTKIEMYPVRLQALLSKME